MALASNSRPFWRWAPRCWPGSGRHLQRSARQVTAEEYVAISTLFHLLFASRSVVAGQPGRVASFTCRPLRWTMVRWCWCSRCRPPHCCLQALIDARLTQHRCTSGRMGGIAGRARWPSSSCREPRRAGTAWASSRPGRLLSVVPAVVGFVWLVHGLPARCPRRVGGGVVGNVMAHLCDEGGRDGARRGFATLDPP